MAGIGTSKVPPEVMVSPGTVTPEGSFSTAEVTEAPNVGAVKVKFVPGAEFDCWTAVGVTQNVPVNDSGATTLRLGSGGWPAVPVCATTPECPTARRVEVGATSGLPGWLPPLALATVPPPGVAVTPPAPLLNEAESAMVVP